MSMVRNGALVVAALLAGLVLSGCGRDQPAEQPKEGNPFAGASFVLVPGQDGTLEVRDANGKPVAPSDAPPGKGIKAIRNLSQVAVLRVDGSCFYWVFIGGRWYQVPC